MLRGRSPQGLGGAVYLLVRSFIRAYLFVNMRSSMLSIGVFGDVIENCSSMLDRTGALDRTVQQSSYCKGPQQQFSRSHHPKIFHHRPRRLQPPLGPVRTLCDVSALALDLNFKDQVCSRYHVQVQSPISTAWLSYIASYVISLEYRNITYRYTNVLIY